MPSQQEIERIVEEFDAKFFIGGTNALGEEKPLLFPAKVEVRDWLRTTLASLTEAHKVQMEKVRKKERERIEAVFKEHVPPHAMDLEDSVWLKRLLNKAFHMSHDFEPTEAEKEMLSHIKDIEVNRKQSELGNIISGAILDGQNQIHDLYKEKATAQEVEYRMRRSYTYWMNKLHQELQKARESWLREEIVKLEGMKLIARSLNQFMSPCKYNSAINNIIKRYQSELDQPTESKKICCRWCCSEKHEHIQCTDSSRCHCPCHDQPTNITSE